MLLEHLRTKCPLIKAVLPSAEMRAIDQLPVGSFPAAFVMYEGAKVKDRAAKDNRSALISQIWRIAIRVKNVSDIPAGQPQRSLLGEPIHQVLATLTGQVFDGFSPIRLAGESKAIYTEGFATFPFFFETDLVINRIEP